MDGANVTRIVRRSRYVGSFLSSRIRGLTFDATSDKLFWTFGGNLESSSTIDGIRNDLYYGSKWIIW